MQIRKLRFVLSLVAALAAGVAILAAPVFARLNEAPVGPASSPSVTGSNGHALRDSLARYAQNGETCFFKGEKTDGLNKICFYDCASGEAAITIGAASLCPLSIER